MPTDYDWPRLGSLLPRRRTQLNPRWRVREQFARDRGVSPRAVADLENGRPRVEKFTPATWAALEDAYEVVDESLRRTAAGGPLEPRPPAEAADTAPMASAAPEPEEFPADPRARAVISAAVDGSQLEQAVRARVASRPKRSRGDVIFTNRADIEVWDDRNLAEDTRVEMIAALWALRNEAPDLAEERPAS